MSKIKMRKKVLTRISIGANPVFDYQYITKEAVDDAYPDIPRISKFSTLFKEMTKTIHAIPTIFSKEESLSLGSIRVYLGRTGNLAHTSQRHYETKKLPYIIPIARVSVDNAKSFEKWGLRLILKLQEQRILCCGLCLNGTSASAGKLSSEEETLIYVAFGFDRKMKSAIGTKSIVRKFAHWLEIEGLFNESAYKGNTKELTKAIELISIPSAKNKLYWEQSSRPF